MGSWSCLCQKESFVSPHGGRRMYLLLTSSNKSRQYITRTLLPGRPKAQNTQHHTFLNLPPISLSWVPQAPAGWGALKHLIVQAVSIARSTLLISWDPKGLGSCPVQCSVAQSHPKWCKRPFYLFTDLSSANCSYTMINYIFCLSLVEMSIKQYL